MKKIFISADIEGTCGIAAWNETEKDRPEYAAFVRQMTREVAAACEGALAAGAELVVVRDAHDSARNLEVGKLPAQVQVIRGWGQDPLCMMNGLDESFDAVVFTGYHDAAGSGTNPLSHTLSPSLVFININGETASEGMINAYTAAYYQVPVVAVSGDAGICAKMKALLPQCQTIAVNQGRGGAVLSIHPDLAVARIKEGVQMALSKPDKEAAISLPASFRVELRYVDHPRAWRMGFYPGVKRLDSHTLLYESADWFEVLRMLHFCA